MVRIACTLSPEHHRSKNTTALKEAHDRRESEIGMTVERREYIRQLASKDREPLRRAQRVFLEEPSFAITGKKDYEFDIKQRVSNYFSVPFRSIAFCGSAHLGFSPHKNTEFRPGGSDLDIAIISMNAFQDAWATLVETTKAFTDLSGFPPSKKKDIDTPTSVREMMSKRGLLHLDNMPKCERFDNDRTFLDTISKKYNVMFSSVKVSFYISEYAFCWKQNSAIQGMIRR